MIESATWVPYSGFLTRGSDHSLMANMAGHDSTKNHPEHPIPVQMKEELSFHC